MALTLPASSRFAARSRRRRRGHMQGPDRLMELCRGGRMHWTGERSEEHTSELQSPCNLVCRLLLEKKKKRQETRTPGQNITSDYPQHTRRVCCCATSR